VADETYEQLALFDLPEQPAQAAPATEPQPEMTLDDFSDEMLAARLRLLIEQNKAKVQQLLAAQMMPDPRSVLTIRLDTLLDLIFTPSERLRFNVLFESKMSTFLDRCLAERSRADLLAPLATPAGPPPGGLILPPH